MGGEWDPDMQGQRCQQPTKEGEEWDQDMQGQRYQQLTVDGRRVEPRYARSKVTTAYQRREKSGTQICKVRGDNSLPKKGEEWDPDMQGQR